MNWFNKLTSNEKKLVKYGSIVIAIALLWVIVYRPITRSITYKQQQKYQLNNQYSQMEDANGLLNQQKINKTKFHRDINKPFISWIDEQLEKNNLAQFVSRSEPKDNKTLILTFENIVFDDLAKWLQSIEQNFNILINEADINVTDRSNGLCNARLTLEE